MSRSYFVARRLAMSVPLMLAVMALVFMLEHFTPGDPARRLLGPLATKIQVAQLHRQLGLNQPLPVQYLRYVERAVSGNLGTSLFTGQSVTSLIAKDLPVTLALGAAGTLVALVIALPLGLLASQFPNRAIDHAIRGATVLALTMPSFWVGIMLLLLVALPTGLFPVSGWGNTLPQHAQGLVLPGLTLGIALAPVLIRSLRASLIEVREAEYVATARSAGVKGWRLARRHLLPNAIAPVITLLGVEIGFLLFFIVVVENTFALPGLGAALVQAATGRDFPVVQGITLAFGTVVVIAQFLIDVAYMALDPRVLIE